MERGFLSLLGGIQPKTFGILTKQGIFGMYILSMVLGRKVVNTREEKKLNNGLQSVSLLMLLAEKELQLRFGNRKNLYVLRV